MLFIYSGTVYMTTAKSLQTCFPENCVSENSTSNPSKWLEIRKNNTFPICICKVCTVDNYGQSLITFMTNHSSVESQLFNFLSLLQQFIILDYLLKIFRTGAFANATPTFIKYLLRNLVHFSAIIAFCWILTLGIFNGQIRTIVSG